MTKIVAIIQARMGSQRLPGKVLAPILGQPLLWHVITRVRAASAIDAIVVATSAAEPNDVIRDFCAAVGIECFSGSENDVLDRFLRAAEFMAATDVLRVTADCAAIDPLLIGELIEKYRAGRFDYVALAAGAGALHDTQPRFPDGVDAEIMSIGALRCAWSEAREQCDREHVTPYIWRNDKLFARSWVRPDRDYSRYRLCIDRPEDLDLITQVYTKLYQPDAHFGYRDVIRVIDENPHWRNINRSGIGQEGYEGLWQERKHSGR